MIAVILGSASFQKWYGTYASHVSDAEHSHGMGKYEVHRNANLEWTSIPISERLQ